MDFVRLGMQILGFSLKARNARYTHSKFASLPPSPPVAVSI